jgi:hypothetical protein
MHLVGLKGFRQREFYPCTVVLNRTLSQNYALVRLKGFRQREFYLCTVVLNRTLSQNYALVRLKGFMQREFYLCTVVLNRALSQNYAFGGTKKVYAERVLSLYCCAEQNTKPKTKPVPVESFDSHLT